MGVVVKPSRTFGFNYIKFFSVDKLVPMNNTFLIIKL